MLKKMTALVFALTLFFPVTAYAASSGFYGIGGYTETTNGYFFDYKNAILVDNKEIIDEFNYDEFHAGSTLYMPLGVYVGNAIKYDVSNFNSTAVTEKMVKEDSVSISSKVLLGNKHVGDIELVDGKKLKINGLPSNMYVKIPIVMHYESFDKDEILIQFVLSVNGVGYQDTLTNLSCFIVNRLQYIDRNTVYGAKHPAQYHVWQNYSGEATFDFGENVKYTNRVFGGDDYYFDLSREPDENILQMYDDKNTYLEFYNFKGDQDNFSLMGKLEIPVKREKLAAKKGGPESLFVYRIENDSLVAMGDDEVSFDSKTNKLTIETYSLDNYVVSNRALLREIYDYNDNNILKTGYAIPEAEEEEALLQGGAQGTGHTSPAPAHDPLSGLTQSEIDMADEIIVTDDYGYVPEESEFFNDNAQTGVAISATNPGSENPSTSDDAAVPFAVAVMCISGLLMLLIRNRHTAG